MHKLWLLLCQSITVSLGVFFVISTLRPDLLPFSRGVQTGIVTIKEANIKQKYTALPEEGLRYAAEKAMPAVVNIYTTKQIRSNEHPFLDDPFWQHFFGDQFEDNNQRNSSLGSGVIITAEGYILTNHHVIEAAKHIEVALSDGRKIPAKIVGTDPDSDLAVLKIQSENVPYITIGNSKEAAVGDIVLAIGNPFGVGQTVTMGIISAVERTQLGLNTFENFIQTDAAINPGNSGGALVDKDGNLIGINTAIYSRSGGSMGIGFAIPAYLAQKTLEDIVKTGYVTRGWIGVQVQDLSRELAESFDLKTTDGTLVAGILRGGPASKAGIKAGDILVAINSIPIKNSNTMLNIIASLIPGDEASATLLRNGKTSTVRIKIGTRPP